jgi:hypothetical protein
MDTHNFKRLTLSQAEFDMLTGFRRFVFSDKGRAKRTKQGYNRRFRRKVRQSLVAERAA